MKHFLWPVVPVQNWNGEIYKIGSETKIFLFSKMLHNNQGIYQQKCSCSCRQLAWWSIVSQCEYNNLYVLFLFGVVFLSCVPIGLQLKL